MAQKSLIPVVDAHVHFWVRQPGALEYAWLDSGDPHPILRADEMASLRSGDRGPDRFAGLARASGVSHVVHVEAGVSGPDPVAETVWLDGAAKELELPLFLVGSVDLLAADAAETLDRHRESPRFVGIRDLTNIERYGDADYGRAASLLAERSLLQCLFVTWPFADAAARLARRQPDVIFIVDHMMLPLARDRETFDAWSTALRGVAAVPNVVCKISEFTMVDHAWDRGRSRRWVEECLEAFGPARCIVGSNWPMGSSHTSYAEVVAGLRWFVAELSLEEQEAVLCGNALSLMSQHARGESA